MTFTLDTFWQSGELAAILLLVSVAQGVIDVTPRAARRVAWGFLSSLAAFAVGTALLSFVDMAYFLVLVGMVLLGLYVVRWMVGSIVEAVRGPFFFVAPTRAELADALRENSGLSRRECRRVARRIARRRRPNAALLGLMTMKLEPGMTAAELEAAWDAAAEEAERKVSALIAGLGGREKPTSVDVAFVAQALCMYERDSVVSALGGRPVRLGKRSLRAQAVEQLRRTGRRRPGAESFGLCEPPATADDRATAGGLTAASVLWPAVGLRRAGFARRARALALSEAVVLAYGLFAVLFPIWSSPENPLAIYLCRGSGWVFLGVGVLLHIQAIFAVGDFHWLAAHRRGAGRAEGKVTA